MKKIVIFTLTLLFAMTTVGLTTAYAQNWEELRRENQASRIDEIAFSSQTDEEYVYGIQRKPSGSGSWVIRHKVETHDLDDSGSSNNFYSIAVRPQGDEIVIGGNFSHLEDRKADLSLDPHNYDCPGTEYALSLAYSPDGAKLAAGTDENVILIWTYAGRAFLRKLQGHTDDVDAVAWSPDGSILASGSRDGTVRLWNPNTGVNYAVLRGHKDRVYSVAWSPDGDTLASGSRISPHLILWDVDTETKIRTMSPGTCRSLAWFPDGETLAAVGWRTEGGFVRLYNPNTGATKQTLYGHSERINSIALHPNGQIIASASSDTDLIFWESTARFDVTNNGTIDINDLVEVARNYGKTVGGGANVRADVDGNGRVDIEDLTLVARRINAAFAAPTRSPEVPDLPFTAQEVQQWIQDAKAQGVDAEGIAALEQLLQAVLQQAETPPKETVLLANYPNPFNPETWIPYQLAEPAEITVSIHATDGKLVRTLALGQLPAGVYQEKDRAAYWDGKNEQGESVASGLYFYTLKAGDFSATKKMLIRK